MSYQEGLEYKKKKYDLLFLSSFDAPIISLDNPENSRNKLKLSAMDVGGNLFFGLFDKNGEFKAREDCPLELNILNRLLPEIRQLMIDSNVSIYDLQTRKGEFKGIILSTDQNETEVMVRLVLRSKEGVDRIKINLFSLLSKNPQIKIVTCMILKTHTPNFTSDEEIKIYGDDYICENFNGIKLLFGKDSFFQVTPKIANLLYGELAHFLENNRNFKVLDLFCGVGAFSIFSAPYAKSVLGVEISQSAIHAAKENAKMNDLSNVDFISADVNSIWDKIDRDYDLVIVNPPRRGVGEFGVKKILELNPAYLVYSSCNIETLATDATFLKDNYQIMSSKIFDMFPYTGHFETFMIFKRL